MDQDISRLGDRARAVGGQYWKDLGAGRRVVVIAVGTIGVALIALFFLWARTPSYEVAYANLDDEQAGAVVAKLKEMNVPYEIRDGSTVLVPAEQVADVRLELATAGLPQESGSGYELFDQTNFGLTEFAEKINYQRALEGELSRTINHIDAVEQSRIHIVLPQESLYTDVQKEATASVVLILKAGRQLTSSQLRGITQLVSGSVEGLKAEKVTIVDGKGNVLSTPSSDGLDAASTQTKVDAQRAYEIQLATDIQNMLNRIVGSDRTTVQVSASMDWDQVESSSEVYSPAGQLGQIRSQYELIEGSSVDGSSAGGIPGVDSNIPTYQQASATKTATPVAASLTPGTQTTATATPQATTTKTTLADGVTRRESTINYELSRQTEHVVHAPGAIKRLTIAVAVDSTTVAEDQVESLSKAITAAAGLDQTRGDALTVVSMPFAKVETGTAQATAEEQQQELILSTARTAAIVVGPLILLLALWLMLRRPARRPKASSRLVEQPLRMPMALQQPAPAAIESASNGASALLKEAQKQQEIMRQGVYDLASKDPAMVAQLIQTWLEEDAE